MKKIKEYIEVLIKELVKDDVILVNENKINLFKIILEGLYIKGKTDYEKEVRKEFKNKVKNILEDI